MQKIFIFLYNYLHKNKPILYSLFVATFVLFLLFATRIKFIEDVYAIIPKDKKTEKLTQVFQSSKFADKLAIMVSLKDTTITQSDSLVAYADIFAEKLEQSASPYIKSFRYKVEDDIALQLFETIQQHLPVFLSEKDYQKIDTLIAPSKLKETLDNDIKLMSSPTGFAIKNIIANDPSGISFIALKKLQQLQYDDNFELYDNHIVTKDNKTLMMFITPAYAAGNTGKNKAFFSQMDHLIDSLNKNGFAQINTQYFGGAVVSEGNAAQIRRDTILTQGITVLFLILFIGLYFRKKRAPVLILLPVVYGAAFSLAVIYFIKGSISVIALGTGSIVLGIAVSYSLHVLNHYRHTGDIRRVIKDLTYPLTIGSFTTIFGFFSLQFAASDMLKDLGLFAGFSLIGAALCSLIFLPHFIGAGSVKFYAKDSWISRIASIRLEHNHWLVGIIFLLTVFFFFHANDVQYESDMMQLNYMSGALKKAEQKLNRISGASLKSLYVVTDGKTLEESLKKNEQLQIIVDSLKSKQLITTSTGVSALFLSDSLQQSRIHYWNKYWTNEKKRKIVADLTLQGALAGFNVNAFSKFKSFLNKEFAPVDKDSLNDVRKNYLDDYISEKPEAVSVVTLLKVPQQNKQQVDSILEKVPATTVLDRQYLTTRFTDMVNNDFGNIAWVVSLLVLTVLFLTYGRIELTLISFIPMLMSWIWILGIMALAGMTFNIVNIIISALIFGLGDDYSLFVMDGLLSEYKTGKKNLESYKSSILISAITTIAGLGVLIFAKHPALRSIAFISVTGILCVVLMSQILIPFFFSLFIERRVQKKCFPWTLWSGVRSFFAFAYFTAGAVVLSAIGFVLLKVNPFYKKQCKYAYHWLFSKMCKSVVYIMGNVTKKIINPDKENFTKPAIVIANHQSSLDIITMAMLSPKLILLTNNWVWNSPLYGWAIKMADFFPVSNGIENSVDLLSNQFNNGYSIVIFPEGTRTSHPPMKRFHKGAFYLAERLNADIVPVLLHGTGHTMNKDDYFLKNGTITVKYLPRIQAEDKSWGTTYQERLKSISKHFKAEHTSLSTATEQTKYFKEQLAFNYIYKGPVLEWYLRIKTKMDGYYQQFHDLLPKEGKILDLGCGYGFPTYLLYWASQNRRQITGVDYDEDKIETANHCFSKTDDLKFVHTDITQFAFEQYNGIIVSDVLHYLQPEKQNEVIEKAIQSLLPGGVLLIRDGDADMKEKHKGTRLTEFLSTKVFSFNKTVNKLHFLSGKTIENFAQKHGLNYLKIDHTKYTSNVIWILTRE
jgi:uncharacterized protein